MDSKKITALSQVSDCIKSNQNFILQGGAGSGKTETLKQVLELISKNYPDKKIACITHTNLAVDQIISRVGDGYTICTIHSFLNSIIKDYKKNIHNVIVEIFKAEKIERKDISFYEDEKDQNKQEHDNFKKLYEKYAKKLFTVNGVSSDKVVGKRDYDKNPEFYNKELNDNIENLNIKINDIIKNQDFNKVEYNETRFDSFKDLTFGHDSLLKIAFFLFEKYDLLANILRDKFDIIFIDEYQDTHKDIIEVFLKKIPSGNKTIVGLFGDSMQGIYDDGIGDVEKYIEDGDLLKIEKEDNYRSSEQIINFINLFRNDGLKQEVALKTVDGIKETIGNRQGFVMLYYAIYDAPKPHTFSNSDDKERYLSSLNSIIKEVDLKHPDYKKLMLTNKSISKEVGFENLYQVFNDRYTEVKEEIEKDLTRLQLIDLMELCKAYKDKKYNFILTKLKKSNFELNSISDKLKVKEIIDGVISSEKSAFSVLELAFKNKILKESDFYSSYIDRKNSFIKEINKDPFYLEFKKLFEAGHNTFPRMSKEKDDLENEVFDEYFKIYKKERFYLELFSDKIKFKEIINYYDYLNEETSYITMHKTKGSGINNVLVVLEEYFWNKYNFKSIFDSLETDDKKKLFNQKLFYVACSRAINNLICVKLILPEEEEDLLKKFSNSEKLVI